MEPVPHLQNRALHSLGINNDFLESKEAIDYLKYDFVIDVEVFHVDVDVIFLDLGRLYCCVEHVENNALQNYLLVVLEVIDPLLSFLAHFDSYIIRDFVCSFASCSG